MSLKFHQQFVNKYKKLKLMKIDKIIINNVKLKKNIIILLYEIINNLLYYNNIERRFYLCILINLKKEIFKFAHNEQKYFKYS